MNPAVFARPNRSVRLARGTTLLELLVALAVAGILVALPLLGWRAFHSRMRARGDMGELRDALLLARSEAMARGRSTGVVLDRTQRRFLRFVDSSLVDGSSNDAWESGERIEQDWRSFSPTTSILRLTVAGTPSSVPRTCSEASAPPGSTPSKADVHTIVFHPDGSASASLQALLGSTGSPADTFHLTIVPATGLVDFRR